MGKSPDSVTLTEMSQKQVAMVDESEQVAGRDAGLFPSELKSPRTLVRSKWPSVMLTEARAWTTLSATNSRSAPDSVLIAKVLTSNTGSAVSISKRVVSGEDSRLTLSKARARIVAVTSSAMLISVLGTVTWPDAVQPFALAVRSTVFRNASKLNTSCFGPEHLLVALFAVSTTS